MDDSDGPVPTGGDDLAGWTLVAEPEVYVGEELFQLINGGAEMYHEFGFVQVHAAEYELGEAHSISLELFEMIDEAAAFGVYSFKKGDGGTALDIGQACVRQDYYLNLWTGSYVLTLTGMASDDQTLDGLERLARATASGIGGEPSELPTVVQQLSHPSDRSSAVHFLRGDLALANAMPYLGDARFFFDEGAEKTVGEHQVVCLQYQSVEAALHHLERVVDDLIGGDRYDLHEQHSEPEVALLIEREGSRSLRLLALGPTVVGVFGPDGEDARAILAQARSDCGN